MVIDSRVCTKCGLDKPLPEFSKHPRGKYGRKPSCKSCDAARHAASNLPSRALPPEVIKERLASRRGDSKECGTCGETKPYALFSLSRKGTGTTSDVYRGNCKQCQAAAARKWYDDNTERAGENRRRHNLGKYDLTIEEYGAMLAAQGGVCAICGNPETKIRQGKVMRLCVDHCHKDGRVRGLLCNNCNRALGLLKDNSDLLRKAVGYLERE